MPNPKCPMCKCYITEPEMKSSGEPYKSCKKCRDKNKKYREDNPDKIKEYSKKYYEENADKLKEVNKKYREDNPDKIKEKTKKYYEENADKVKKYNEANADKIKKWRNDNINKIRENQRIFRKENPDKCKGYAKKYYDRNVDKIRERHKKNHEDSKCEHNKKVGYCKICNLNLYLVNLQRTHIFFCLKVSTLKKTKPSISYLGCDANYFIDYFKKKMDIWNEKNEIKMDFSNIHIDHIKPVSSFNLDDEEEFLDCCNYTNLQPLLIKDNLSKNDKWTDDDNKYWNENIKGKEHLEIYLKMI
jgi:hypothetical protein